MWKEEIQGVDLDRAEHHSLDNINPDIDMRIIDQYKQIINWDQNSGYDLINLDKNGDEIIPFFCIFKFEIQLNTQIKNAVLNMYNEYDQYMLE